jgi:Flp pilus assembly pilin Flp
MGYSFLGAVHARLHALVCEQRGQGTVEYVALILLIAGVMAAVVVAGKGMKGANIAQTIVGKLKDSIEAVGGG